MGKDSGIQWTNHTFNPWRGCTKVSAGCLNCYAETLSKRNPAVLGTWGPKGTRVVASESKWKEPLAWHGEVPIGGTRKRVFTASLADVFEDWPGKMIGSNGHAIYKGPLGDWWRSINGGMPGKGSLLRMDDVRHRLFALIAATPRLDWLVLTKRPDRMVEYFASKANFWAASEQYRDLIYGRESEVGLGDGLSSWPPSNMWAGTSVENQEQADARIPELLKVPAKIRFLSMEPLLGPVDLSLWLSDRQEDVIRRRLAGYSYERSFLHWVIVGGESGHNARPFDLAWAYSIRDQCKAAGVSFFMKQIGSNPNRGRDGYGSLRSYKPIESHGGDWEEWPEDLRIRQFPNAHHSLV